MNLLFVSRHSPVSGWAARELLDMALISAAFEHTSRLLFMGSGVLQLTLTQPGNPYQDVHEPMSMLEIYGITECYVDTDSAQHFGLKEDKLPGYASLASRQDIQQLFQQADNVIII